MLAAISGNYSQSYWQIQAITATQNQTVQAVSSAAKQPTVQLKADTVTISVTAQALSLFQEGLTIEQIAIRLGLDVDTVRSYLGLPPRQSAASTAPTTNALHNLLQTAYQSGVDANTINNFWGVSSSQSETASYQAANNLMGTLMNLSA